MRNIYCFIFGIIWIFNPITISAKSINCQGVKSVTADHLDILPGRQFWTIKYVGNTEHLYPSGAHMLAVTVYTFLNDSYEYVEAATITEKPSGQNLPRPWYYKFSFHVDDKRAMFQADSSVLGQSGSVGFGSDNNIYVSEAAISTPDFTFALTDVRMNGDLLFFQSCDERFFWVQISNNLMKERQLKKKNESYTQTRHHIFSLKKKVTVIPIDPLDEEIQNTLKFHSVMPEDIISTPESSLPARLLNS